MTPSKQVVSSLCARSRAHASGLWPALFIALASLTACKQSLSVPDADAGDGFGMVKGNATADDPEPEACENSDDGEACGEDKHCIKRRCVFNSCGDGVKAGDEECDDGNALADDVCTPSCKEIMATCGDGNVDEGEECDDGNHIDVDVCSNGCTKNACGNKRVDPGEECDDGDREDENLCSNACLHNLCRNGILDPGEECDDGNTNPSDGCTNACQRILCGDGMAEQQEECDDGNRVNTDSCSNACTKNICGNNRVDPGEACDGPLTAEGKPIPDGFACENNCAGLKDDAACRQCEREKCSDYMGSGIDLPKYCYDEVAPDIGAEGFPDYNKKCAALVRCIQQNACDVNLTHIPAPDAIGCYCGKDGTIDDCFGFANHQYGPCVPEFEAATGAVKGDFMFVSSYAVAQAVPAGMAWFLAQCQATECLSVCR